MYRAHSCSIFTFLNNFQTIIHHSPKHYLIINMGDFYFDILKDNNQAKNKYKLLNFMDRFQLNHNLMKTPQKLDFNYIIYGQISPEMNTNLV